MSERPLLAWITDEAPDDRGIHFSVTGGAWDFWSYRRLARLACDVARGLVRAGVGPGDVVSFVQRSGPEFVGTLFGTMLAGAVASPVAPPMVFQNPEVYQRHVTGLLDAARPAVVVTEPDLMAEVSAHAPAVPVPALLSGQESPPPERVPARHALLQFTSGSSGRARGVRVQFPALESNVDGIRHWLGMDGRRATASWLPLHHDMGLIGCLITPIVDGSDLWLLSPEEFVAQPLRYLHCFATQGAQLTAMPSFGLQYIARRIRPDALSGLDFSGWRAIIVGAERVPPEVLHRFHALLGPYGLSRKALLPAYGLAEATLAVTGLPAPDGWTVAGIVPSTLSLGAEVEVGADDSATMPVVGCGRPLPGVELSIVDGDGRPLAAGRVGEIVVRGRSVADGYAGSAQSRSLTTFSEGALHTGDAGFLHDGQLHVLGRLGDSMKVRARAVFAEDLEAALVTAGVPGHRVAVALGERAGVPTAVAVLEEHRPQWTDQAWALLHRMAEGAEVVVVTVPPGTVPRTSSGKPKRRELWQAFLDGHLRPGVAPAGSAPR